jgi:hypothetical protein
VVELRITVTALDRISERAGLKESFGLQPFERLSHASYDLRIPLLQLCDDGGACRRVE